MTKLMMMEDENCEMHYYCSVESLTEKLLLLERLKALWFYLEFKHKTHPK